MDDNQRCIYDASQHPYRKTSMFYFLFMSHDGVPEAVVSCVWNRSYIHTLTTSYVVFII